MDRTTRRLAAILAADVVGYSRLMGEDQAGTLAALRQMRGELLQPLVAEHGGTVVKSMGDGWLVEFAAVSDAVGCALAVQQGLDEHPLIKLRIGIHLGDIAHEDDDIYGDGVNIAARLQEQAPPEAVLISDDVLRQLDRKQAAAFLSVGEQVLKNIAQPVTTWVWPAALAAEFRGRVVLASNRKPTVRVDDVVGHSDNDVELAATLGEDLVVSLSTLTGIDCVVDGEAADYRLRATVRTAGSRARVTAQLVEVAGKRQIWAERYTQESGEIFDFLDDCVYRLSVGTRMQIYKNEGVRLAGRDIDSMPVEELLSFAASKFLVPDVTAWMQIPSLMERVLERDPDNFMALAMAANAMTGEYFYGYRVTNPRDVTRAMAWIDKAQRINSSSDFVHFTRATVLAILGSAPEDAILAAHRALELNPNYAYGFSSLAAAQVYAGDYAEALTNSTRAIEADRRHPHLHLFHWTAGLAHVGAGDFDQAIEACKRAQELMPQVPPILMGLAASHWMAGRQDEARSWGRRLVDRVPAIRVADIFLPPYRDGSVRERYADALREAGVPP